MQLAPHKFKTSRIRWQQTLTSRLSLYFILLLPFVLEFWDYGMAWGGPPEGTLHEPDATMSLPRCGKHESDVAGSFRYQVPSFRAAPTAQGTPQPTFGAHKGSATLSGAFKKIARSPRRCVMKPSAFHAAGFAPPHHQQGRPVETACPRVAIHRAVSVRRAYRTGRPLNIHMHVSGHRRAWCAPAAFWRPPAPAPPAPPPYPFPAAPLTAT